MRAPTRERLLFVWFSPLGRSREYDNARPGTFNRRRLVDCGGAVSNPARLSPVTVRRAGSEAPLAGG